jgi:phosphotransferase system HPr-like phosphotransfer protein
MISERIYSSSVSFSGSGRERLRGIARFALLTLGYDCSVVVTHRGHKADGKKIIEMLALPFRSGEGLRVEVSGPEALECLESLGLEGDESLPWELRPAESSSLK